MRVVHVSDCYLPRLGGIEVQVSELATRQRAHGHDVAVITATPGEQVREGLDRVAGVPVYRVTARMPYQLPVHPRTRRHVAPLLADLAPDVVHVHVGVISPFAWGSIRAAVDVGVPVLATVHSVWGRPARLGYSVADSLTSWSGADVRPAAVSEVAARPIRAAFGPQVPVLITPNAVDADQWNALGRRPWHPGEPVRCISAMRLAPRKRAQPLLRMFAAAVGASPGVDLRLDVAGDGPDRAKLEWFIDDHGLHDRVRLLGRLSRPDLRAAYLTADVFIQPSVQESFGLAALEARATGLPIVARRQSGLTEFVTDEVEGLLADDDDGMAAAITRLATNDALRAAITRHNTDVAPSHTWPAVLAGLDEAYAVTIAR